MTLNLNRTLCLILLCAVVGACGDDDGGDDGGDDSGAAVCGDGLINGDEDCDGVLLGGADCTDAGNYTGGRLACTGDCTFDTSSCTADELCGNGVIDDGEECDGAELGGASCTSVGGGFAGGDLACAADCSFDTSGCSSSEGSAAIAAARAAPDGPGQSLPVSGVLVTYVKPALGQDPAGIFIQAEQVGPALFVAVDPATLTPPPAVGDEVSFTITEMVTSAGQRRALAVSDFSVDASGADVSALVQDVSDEDTLVSALGDFDSELVTLEATVVADFTPAGNPAVAAVIATAGLPADPDLRLRLDGALRDALDLASGCSVTIGPTPLWRFNETAQPSIWAADDVDISACNAPRVVAAAPTGATSVVITFDRLIAPATVQPDNFTFDPALDVEAAAATARTVTLTTATQTPLTDYTVTVANVTDQRNTPVDAAADTASFVGFGDAEATCDDNVDNDLDGAIDCFDPDCAEDAACQFEAQLYIWEIDPDNPQTDNVEFIEIWNNTGAAVNFATEGWYVLLVNGSNDLTYDVIQLGPGTLPADGVWTIGSMTVPGVDQIEFTTDGLQNGADGVLLVNCDTCAGPADFSGDGSGFDPGTGATITSDSGQTGTKVDGVAHHTGDPDDPELQAKLGVTAQFDEAGAGDSQNDSLQRTSLGSWFTFDPSAGTFE